MSNGSKSQVSISFKKEECDISSASTNSTFINVTITDKKNMHSLNMMYMNDGKNYWMNALTVKFVMDNTTFPNATNTNKTVSAKMEHVNGVFLTKLNNSYQCLLDTELQLSPNDTLTAAWLSMSGLQLEAFSNSTNFSTAAKCFGDRSHQAHNETLEFIKGKTVCARISAKVSVEVVYAQISGKTIKTTIPIPPNATVSSANCGKKKIKGTISLDGDGVQLYLEYDLVPAKAKAAKSYLLATVTLTYNSSNRFFPNAPYSTKLIPISNTSLNAHSTPEGMSYMCMVDEILPVTSNMSVMLSDTQWEAFGNLKSKGFHNASDCEEMKTTPMPPVTTPQPNPIIPETYLWKALDGNRTCFLAVAGFQFRASYLKKGDKETTQVWFDFNNATDTVSSTNCSKDSMNVTIGSWGDKTSRNQSVLLTFSKRDNMTQYALTGVKITFQVNNGTFVNATTLNTTVEAYSNPKIVLMPSSINQTYYCSMETQVRVSGNESASSISNIFLRIYNVSDLESFPVNGKFSNVRNECFRDRATPPSTQGDWIIKNKNRTCARIKSNFTLQVAYLDIMDKIQYVTIPVEGNNVSVVDSECTNNTTRIVLDIENTKMLNLTLAYKIVPKSRFFAADEQDYVMNEIMFSYMSDHRYFQNHKTYGTLVKVTSGSDLSLFPTPVGYSYQCDLLQTSNVGNETQNSMVVDFEQARWEAFSLNNSGNFSEANLCPAEVSTVAPKTTVPVTPQPHIPSDPVVSKILVRDAGDNKTVCLLAVIGVQIRMDYNTTKPGLANIGFNMNPNETEVTGSCSKGNTSMVTFYNKHDTQTVTLTFSRSNNKTYLSMVHVKYNITSSYPNHDNNITNPYEFSIGNLTELSTSLKQSYNCSDETDILVDVGNNVIVRIMGKQLQAFDVENEIFSPVSQCLSDTLPTKATIGQWTVSANKTACAKYIFSATFNITYPTVLGKQKSMVFQIGNSTNYFDGACQNESSYFWVQMEQITFAFLFNKTDVNGGKFKYHMYAVVVGYTLPSKYLPNHAYSDSNNILLLNSTLNLFESDNSHSYKCAAAASATLNHTMADVQFKNVQVQPFGLEKNGDFSSADDCNATKWSTKKITIVSVIGGLIVFVIFAGIVFFVYRKRRKAAEYDSLH